MQLNAPETASLYCEGSLIHLLKYQGIKIDGHFGLSFPFPLPLPKGMLHVATTSLALARTSHVRP